MRLHRIKIRIHLHRYTGFHRWIYHDPPGDIIILSVGYVRITILTLNRGWRSNGVTLIAPEYAKAHK